MSPEGAANASSTLIASLYRRGMILFVMLAALAVGSYVVLDYQVAMMEDDLAVINMAGRQRMLSQRITFLGLSLQRESDGRGRERLEAELRKSVDQMEETHRILLNGDAQRGIQHINSPELHAIFFGPTAYVDRDVREFIAAADGLLGGQWSSRESLEKMVLLSSSDLLPGLEMVTQEYQRRAQIKESSLTTLHAFVLLSSLTLLAFAALGVFRPIVARMRQVVQRLHDSGTELRRAIEQNQRILESVGDGIFGIDEQRRIRFANPEAVRLLGWKPEAVIGQPLERFLNMSNRDGSAALGGEDRIDRALAYGESAFNKEAVFQRHDGRAFEVEYTATPIQSNDRISGTVVVFRDISERRRTEEQMHKLALAVEQGPAAVVITDRNGVIEYVNPRFSQVTGFRPSEVIGQTPRIIKSGRNAPDVYKDMWSRIKGGEVWRGELINQDRDGRIFWEDEAISPLRGADGDVSHYVCVKVDITERKRAEEKAILSHARLVDAIQAMEDGFALFDAGDRLALFNEQYVQLLAPFVPQAGMSFEEISRAYAREVGYDVHGDDLEQWLQRRIASHRQGDTNLDIRLRDGRWVRVTEHRTREGGIVGIWSDVTNLKHAIIEANQGSQAKSEFLSRMSHELRTPLNAVLGFGQMLMLDASQPLSESQQKSVDHIIKGGEHLLSLINEILDLSRIENGKLSFSIEDCGLESVVSDCELLTQSLAERHGVRLDFQGCAGIMLRADYTRLKQVLLNFLSNAIKYNRHGGEVRLRAVNRQPGWMRVEISDTGPGIPEEKYGKLFTPFERLGAETTAVEGTGIGLSITRKLVELMGGQIGFESKVGLGSTFWVELPLAGEGGAAPASVALRSLHAPLPAPAEAQVMETALVEKGEQRRILYIEDNQDNADLLRMLLDSVGGVELALAANAEEGLEKMRERVPDLVLLDIALPGMDGFAALREMRNNPALARIPVFAMSANATDRDISRGLAAGFDRYLTKPFNVPELLAAMRSVLA